MAILVTGGAGYIGSVFLEAAKGRDLVVVDNLSRGFRESVDKDIPFYKGDVGNREMISKILTDHDIEACVHFAAFSNVGESVQHPEIYLENNSSQTIALLRVLKEHGVNRFVFSSTCAVYGEPERIPIDETHPRHPENPYGLSKLLVEHALESLSRNSDFSYISLRYFNACGAGDEHGELHDPETHLIPLVLEVAAGQREFISVFGTDYPTEDGTAIRDYIHVLDLAEAHLLALDRLSNGGDSGTFNLGNGNGYSVRQIVDKSSSVTGMEIPWKEAPRRAGDPSTLVADSKLAMEDLGWNPKLSDLEEMIGSAWSWKQHLTN